MIPKLTGSSDCNSIEVTPAPKSAIAQNCVFTQIEKPNWKKKTVKSILPNLCMIHPISITCLILSASKHREFAISLAVYGQYYTPFKTREAGAHVCRAELADAVIHSNAFSALRRLINCQFLDVRPLSRTSLPTVANSQICCCQSEP